MPMNEKIVASCLLALVVSMLLVGVVSDTILRHTVQVVPGIVGLVLLSRRIPWAPYAALAAFVFWLFIMTLIWLFLLGLARVVTGDFSAPEVGLTIGVGLASVAGIVAVLRVRSTVGRLHRVVAFLAFAGCQVAAMWISLQPFFATRSAEGSPLRHVLRG